MKLLALDLATHTGWAIFKDGKIIASGMQDFGKRRGESNGILFLRFRKWLSDLYALESPTLIVYELAHMRGGPATEICVGLQTHAQSFAAEKGIESVPVHTATLKAFINRRLGTKGRDKENGIKAATLILGRDPIDDNEADAVMLGAYAFEEFDPDSSH